MDLLFSHENVSDRHVTNAETMCHIICPALLVSRYYTSLYFSFLVEVPVISTPVHRSMHQVLWMWQGKLLTAAINQANCKPEGSCLTKTKVLHCQSVLSCYAWVAEMLIWTACLKMMFQKKLYMWFLVMTIIIFLIWSKGIILNATFSIDHVVFVSMQVAMVS